MLLKSSIFVTTLALQSCDLSGLTGLGGATGGGNYIGTYNYGNSSAGTSNTSAGSSVYSGNSGNSGYSGTTSTSYSYPEASIGSNASYANVGDSVTFTASAYGGTPPYTYYWWLDGDSAWTVGSSSITRQVSQAGTISMYLTVRDNNGNDSDQYSTQVYVSAPYVPAVSAAPGSPVGTFLTSYGTMIFSAAGGSTYTATYSYDGINGTLSGTLNGTTLTGAWYEPNNPVSYKQNGTFYFSFDSDFESFGGAWDYAAGTSNAGNGQWNGTRVTSGQ